MCGCGVWLRFYETGITCIRSRRIFLIKIMDDKGEANGKDRKSK